MDSDGNGKTPSSEEPSRIFILSNSLKREQGRRVEARLSVEDDRFIVLKGSTVALPETASCPSSAFSVRKNADYVKNGVVIRNVAFANPSAASCFVLGSSCKWVGEMENKRR